MLTVNTVKEYIAYKNARANATTMIKDGVLLFLCFGKWVEKDVFEILYPVVEYVRPNEKGENQCKKHNYINNGKSY